MSPINCFRRGITLVELLVSIAVVGILVSIIVPAVQSSRQTTRQIDCASKLRELGKAATSYTAIKRQLPPGLDQKLFDTAPVYRGSSLFVHLLPLMDQGIVTNNWDFADPLKNTEGDANSRTAHVFSSLLCPADYLDANPILQQGWYYGITSYGGNGGKRSYMPAASTVDGLFHTCGSASEPKPNQRPVKLTDITGGLANTIMFGERNHYDRNFEQFVYEGWTTTFNACGWWGPSGGRRAIGHVTMSAAAPINFKINFTRSEGNNQSPPVTDSASFQHYVDLRWCAWGSGHSGGANFCYADGSTHFLNEAIAQDVLEKLSTRKGD